MTANGWMGGSGKDMGVETCMGIGGCASWLAGAAEELPGSVYGARC
jgi:hypothetical protein